MLVHPEDIFVVDAFQDRVDGSSTTLEFLLQIIIINSAINHFSHVLLVYAIGFQDFQVV